MRSYYKENFPLPFLVCAVTALLISLYLRLTINFSSPYLDESDYCFVGRALFDGKPWNTLTYVFSSKLPIWIIGIGDALGGHIGARIISAILGFASLFFFYKFCEKFFLDRKVPLIATILLSLAAPHIFISKFATYDAICFFFFTAALWAGAVSWYSAKENSWRWAILTALFFFLAVMSKYIAIGYAPLFALALFLRNRRDGIIFSLLIAAGLGIYIRVNHDALMVLYSAQILGAHQAYSTYAQVIFFLLQYTIIFFLLALCGYIFDKNISSHRKIFLALFIFSLPLIAYHVRSRDLISSYKHMIYPAAFLAPVGAYFLNRMLRRDKKHTINFIPGIIFLLLSGISFYQVKQMENAFPNTNGVIAFMNGKISPQSRIMSEDPYLFRYHYYPKLEVNRFEELGYHDNNLDGKYEEQDVIDAVWDGKFDFVYLNYQLMPGLAAKLREGVLPHSYVKIYSEYFKNSEVMRRNAEGTMEVYGLKKNLQK